MEPAAVIRITVALVLGVAAIQKARDVRSFARTIEEHRLSSGPRVSWSLAVGVVLTESLIVAALISGLFLGPAMVAAVVLLAAFSAVTARNLLSERPVDCGCLGSTVRLEMGWATVVANGVLAAGLLGGLSQPTLLAPLAGSETASAAQTVIVVGCATLLAANYWLIAYARSVSHLVDEALTGTEIMELAR